MSDIQWRPVERLYRVARFAPTITLRRSGGNAGFAISADFVRKANISGCTRASLFLSEDGMRLKFHFHNNERDDNAFRLIRDGGGGGSGTNRWVSARALIVQSPTLQRLVEEPVSVRRYEPVDMGRDQWMITIAPCFEQRAERTDNLPDNESGIYRYVRGREVVYIGKGKYRDRCRSPERASWDYDYIEYSRLNDATAETKWETFWLNEHERQYRRLPSYNRIGGQVIKDSLSN